ncbi:MAG: tetratricopeptide repeat protein [Thermoguttaceae bacterium]|jgi:tetratricopeptide (TPR) repeat protein
MSNLKKTSHKHAAKAQSKISTSILFAQPFRTWAGVLLVIVAVFCVYLPSISGDFIFDDDIHLTEDKFIKAADGLFRIWTSKESVDFWPATNTFFWIEWRLWGMHPTGYHVTNLILHVIEALLIWLILRKLSIPGAFLAALIFALHPVNVESAAWIASRKNLMAMLFFLLSILWYLKFAMSTAIAGIAPARSLGGPWERVKTFSSFILHPSSFHFWYWLSLAAFLLAMLGKGSVAILPVLLLGIVWWLRPLTRRDLVRTAPFFAIAIALAAVNMWFQTHGTGETFHTATITERLLGAGSIIWFYLYKALLPVDLAFIYPQWHVVSGNPLWWLPLSAAIAVTIVLWLYRKNWGRPLLFAWGFFCVALLPVMGFADVGFMQYSLVADRYQHIAIIAVIALAMAPFSIWRKRMRGAVRWIAPGIAVAAVGALAVLTWRQSSLYRDEVKLYQAVLEKNPACWMAHNNLAAALINIGRLQEAIEHCGQAIRLKSDYAKAYNNLGIALVKMGQPQKAIEYYQQALKLNPDYADAHNNLGSALIQIGRAQEAIEHCRQALTLNPNFLGARNTLGNAFQSIGQYQQAIEQYEAVLKLDPNFSQVYINLGIILNKTGKTSEAIEHYEKALRIDPDSFEAHNNLANAFCAIGQYQSAIEHYRTALQLNPNYPQVHVNLGSALVATGRFSEAIDQYRQTLQLAPDSTDVYLYLASTYAKNNQSTEAVDFAQKGLNLARSREQTELARQIENWLNAYRAGQSETPAEPPDSKSAHPTP